MSEDVNIEVLDGGLGLVPSSGDEVHACVGVSSTQGGLVATRSPDALIAARGYGPGVEAACLAMQLTGKTVIFGSVPATTPATKTGVDSSGATGSSVVTLSGTPLDTYDGQVVFVKGGTLGTAGATLKYSLDNGETFSPELPLGTAVTFAIPNSGLTVNFAAGTFVAGDTHLFSTTEGKWGDGDVVSVLRALGASVQRFRLIHLVGDMPAASAVTFAAELDALRTKYRYTGLIGHARDFVSGDTDEAGWMGSLTADYASFADPRVSVAAGHYLTSSPISGRRYRRPLSFAAVARMMARPIQEHAGRVKTGALKAISSNAGDGRIYHDEFNTPGLDAARFYTARTRIARPGWFVERPRMMSSPTSDFQIWPHRSVLDKACDITYEILVDELDDDLELDPATGFILEREAQAIESRLRSAYRDGLIATRAASAVTATIKRNTNIISTKTLSASIRVVPKGYVEGIDADIGFTNPSLAIA